MYRARERHFVAFLTWDDGKMWLECAWRKKTVDKMSVVVAQARKEN
jgi:hypothetical protein